jgi:hypothetical protein
VLRLRDRFGRFPLTALAAPEDVTARARLREFYGLVHQAAVKDHLIARRPLGVALIFAAVVPTFFAALALLPISETSGIPWFVAAGLLLFVMRIRIGRLSRFQVTGAGYRALKRRQPLSDLHSLSGLPSPAEGQVWSNYGGPWHVVQTREKARAAWYNGTRTLVGAAAIFGLPILAIVVYGAIATTGVQRFVISVLPGTALAVLVFLYGRERWRRRGLPVRGTVRGQIVRLWTVTDDDNYSAKFLYCCVDDGVSPEGWTFQIEAQEYNKFHVGDSVEVEFNPRSQTLTSITSTQDAGV